MIARNTICLWYDGTALDAATFYAETFADSAVQAVHRAPGDYPAGKQDDVLTVEFTVLGSVSGPERGSRDQAQPSLLLPGCDGRSGGD